MANESRHTDRFEDLCTGYVLNALDAEEREAFKAMLSEASEEQRKLYSDLQTAANQLAFTIERGEPAGRVKERLLEHIRSGRQHEVAETRAKSEGSYFAIAASFALLLISLSLLFYSFNLTRQMTEKDREIENQQVQLSSLQHELRQKEELLSILESREVDVVSLTGMEASPNGYGKIVWDPKNNQALLQVSNLPAIPSDRDYQLWIIKNNKSVSAGIFSISDPEKDTFFKIEQMDPPVDEQSTGAFAVTLEPKGGMPQPTGDMYLMGRMDNE